MLHSFLQAYGALHFLEVFKCSLTILLREGREEGGRREGGRERGREGGREGGERGMKEGGRTNGVREEMTGAAAAIAWQQP